MVTTPLSAPWILLLELESALTTHVTLPDGTQHWLQGKDPCNPQENFQIVLILIWGWWRGTTNKTTKNKQGDFVPFYSPSSSMHRRSKFHCLHGQGWQPTAGLPNRSGTWQRYYSTEAHTPTPQPKRERWKP